MKRILLAASCMIMAAGGVLAENQASVTVVLSADLESFKLAASGFNELMAANGIILKTAEYSLKGQDPAEVIAQIEQRKPDLVLAVGTEASRLVKERIKEIPVIFCMVFNVSDFAGPNSTGVSFDVPASLKLQGVMKVLPFANKIGVLYGPSSAVSYEEVAREGNRLGLQVKGKKIDSESEFPDALKSVMMHADCFFMLIDSKLYFSQSIKYLLLESLRNKYPVIGLSSFYTKAGALVSFECDYADLGRQAGELALRVLAGEKPSDIPAARPRKVKYSINTLTAERLGIQISQGLLKEAGEVFGKE